MLHQGAARVVLVNLHGAVGLDGRDVGHTDDGAGRDGAVEAMVEGHLAVGGEGEHAGLGAAVLGVGGCQHGVAGDCAVVRQIADHLSCGHGHLAGGLVVYALEVVFALAKVLEDDGVAGALLHGEAIGALDVVGKSVVERYVLLADDGGGNLSAGLGAGGVDGADVFGDVGLLGHALATHELADGALRHHGGGCEQGSRQKVDLLHLMWFRY